MAVSFVELVRKVVQRQDRLQAQLRRVQGAEPPQPGHHHSKTEHLMVSPSKPVTITVRAA